MVEEIDKLLSDRLQHEWPVLQKIRDEMCLALCDSGLASKVGLIPDSGQADYSIEIDPVDKSHSLLGIWRDEHGYKRGEVQIREDGGVYAEVDIVLNHPTDKRWFIEAITAWGSKEDISTEFRLLSSV